MYHHKPVVTQMSHYLRTGRVLPAEYFEEQKVFFGGNVTRRVIIFKLKELLRQRPWSTESFVAHYFIGGGRTVDLSAVGLLERFRQNSSVKTAVENFKVRQVNLATNRASNICRKPNRRDITSKDGFSDRSKLSTNVTNDGPLFSVGGSTLFQFSETEFVMNCATNEINLRASLNFRINDRFVDAVDIRNWFEADIDLPFSKPYNIIADWRESFTWRGRF